MDTQTISNRPPRGRPTVAHFILLASFFAVCVTGVVFSTAQSPEQQEREIQDKIPAHLPIKVKIKNPEKVKDLENDGWLADLEVEVKNKGTKPIYFLDFFIEFVDVKRDSGDNISYSFQYGRSKLVEVVTELPTPEDVPIEPGATHVFKLHEDYVKGWNWYRRRVEQKPHPKKVRFFSALSATATGRACGHHRHLSV